MADRPEPNGWELLEGLKRVEGKIDSMGKGFVSAELFTTVVTQLQEDRAEDRNRIDQLQTSQLDSQKLKNQNYFAMTLAIAGPILVGIALFLIQRAGGA